MSTPIQPDDPRLTAYALGELDEAGRAEIEAQLAASDEARREVGAITEAAHLLESALQAESSPELSASRRDAIRAHVQTRRPARLTFLRRAAVWLVLVGAAIAALAIVTPNLMRSRMAADEADLLLAERSSRALSIVRSKDMSVPGQAGAGDTHGGVLSRTEAEIYQAAPSKADRSSLDINGDGVDEEIPYYSNDAGQAANQSYARMTNRMRGENAPTKGNLQNVAVGGEIRIIRHDNPEERPALTWGMGLSRDEEAALEPLPKEAVEQLSSIGYFAEPSSTSELSAGGDLDARRTAGGYGAGMGGGGVGGYGGGMGLNRSGERWGEDHRTMLAADGVVEKRALEERQERVPLLSSLDGELLARRDAVPMETASHREAGGVETYELIADNPFLLAAQQPLSTFSIDVDTASYANVRRFLTQGSLPPKEAVRIEEMINYFDYDYPAPEGADPFAAHIEFAACPWRPEHRLVRIGLKGREIPNDDRPACNLVFLLDVSGSMKDPNKLPLLKQAMRLLVQTLGKADRVALVTFANEARVALSSTTCDEKQIILAAIDSVNADGGTNGGAGIELAYDLAGEKGHFVPGGVNRVILATDGDFNVGTQSRPELVKLIEDRAKSGVFFTALGFGAGNLKDANLEALADKGNGNYAYIDGFNEARKVLVEEMTGTVIAIAKDVKAQVEFNPGVVSAYRLIGYENRVLAARDFNDDRKDAGEIGAGHTVTALYEIVPVGVGGTVPGVDKLRYQTPPPAPENLVESAEMFTLKLRYKAPDGDTSKLIEFPVRDTGGAIEEASSDFRFAAAVAEFGMLLRDSDAKGNATYDSVLELATAGKGPDPQGYRAEFLNLVAAAKAIKAR